MPTSEYKQPLLHAGRLSTTPTIRAARDSNLESWLIRFHHRDL